MSIQQMLLGASGASGYLMDKSLRFRASASAYLNRTPASAGNRQTWTWSGWVKRGQIGVAQVIECASDNNFYDDEFRFQADDTLSFYFYNTAYQARIITTQVFRDPSAWYHLVFVLDTTNATSTDRLRIYVNGTRVTAFTTAVYPSQNYQPLAFNNTQPHNIGRYVNSLSYFDGYLADVNFIDGQALTPASFGETNALTGVWQPKAYTGTYGTNGFYLDFEDTSSVAALGTDKSGNGNTWTVNNVSLTAGVTYDSMTDVPTLTSASAANYAVLNPLDAANSLINANLTATNNGSSHLACRGSIGIPATGLFYIEGTVNATSSGSALTGLGVATASAALNSSMASTASIWGLYAGDFKYFCRNGTAGTVAGTVAAGSVLQLAIDPANNRAWAGINNVWYDGSNGTTGNPSAGTNPTFTSLPANLFVYVQTYFNTQHLNFGQRPFAYTPPTGFVALNTFNLPTATILDGSKQMNAGLYTGDGTLSRTLTGLYEFQPDFIWAKNRSGAFAHVLQDSVRGFSSTRKLSSNTTDPENSSGNATDPGFGYISGVSSTGFSVASTGGGITHLNQDTAPYVGWAWKANGAGSSNTNGTITSTVSVNATAGFSVVTYTGNGVSGATIGHGLGVTPKFIIVKNRTTAQSWLVYHSSIGNTNYFILNQTAASAASAGAWNNTSPTSSVFTVGNSTTCNENGSAFVAYCFSEIDGFSKFGSYTGNGDGTNAPFVYTGFRPKLVIVKASSGVASWIMWDSVRGAYNVIGPELYADLSNAETTGTDVDLLSNGFKFRNSTNTFNAVGTYAYIAFAENPFKNSLAR